jgi:hypothetical protein
MKSKLRPVSGNAPLLCLSANVEAIIAALTAGFQWHYMMTRRRLRKKKIEN